MRGSSDKEIAAQLELSPNTVHGYIKALYRKLQVSSRVELATRYVRVISTEARGSRGP